jgi:type II secretory pathway pseudopilin PulG
VSGACYHENRNQFIAMQLRGQQGYAMAALLIGMSVAAILMTAAMPVWKQMARREKEEELVFRGQQYVRAIALFQRRSGPGVLPPNVDVLVSGRFLRKKFKDPITNDDFDLLSPVQATGQGGSQSGRGGAGQQPSTAAPQQGTVIGAQPGSQAGGRGVAGGIMGVASKSKDASLRVYNGRTHYNEWQFVFVQQTQQAGAPGGAGGRGNPPGGRGQTGTPPPFGGVQGGPGRQGQGPGGRGFGPPAGRGPQPGSPSPAPPTSPFQPRPPG